MTKFNPREYITTQKRETYRAFIIYESAMNHKTEWARQMRDKLGAHLLDLQQYFFERPDLAEKIDRFRPDDFEQTLLKLQKEITESVIVIDNMDFLLNLWSPKHQRYFVSMLAHRLKSPGPTNKTFIFIVQDHPTLIQSKLVNSRGHSRIVRLNEFEAF